MGPRPFSRGVQRLTSTAAPWPSGFNGAAAVQPRSEFWHGRPHRLVSKLQWGRGRSAAEWERRCRAASLASRFNGAAAVQPRSEGYTSDAARWRGVLQWGRGRSAAEWSPDASRLTLTGGASMGPRPFSRGVL